MQNQEVLFRQIREKLLSNVSLVDEISELLEISYDSAYRRIRCEKELSLSESIKLCQHFDLSADSIFNNKSGNVVFKHFPILPPGVGVKQWLTIVLKDLKRLQQSNVHEIIYAAKDPPLFHYFQFPEIGAFKMFFWEKTIFQFPQYADAKFRIADYNPEIKTLGEQILAASLKIPTTDIWNEDTFNITFRQIEHYWTSGLFDNKNDIITLCDKLYIWIEHIKKQAELGFKFLYGTQADGVENSYKFYENEVVLNDNTILVKTENYTATYITYNVLNLLITSDNRFCCDVEAYLKGIMKESILISSVNAKERHRFFNKLLEKIANFRDSIG